MIDYLIRTDFVIVPFIAKIYIIEMRYNGIKIVMIRFHKAMYEEVTRPFRYIQMDLTDGYVHTVVMTCIQTTYDVW